MHAEMIWFKAVKADSVPQDSSVSIKYKNAQLAVYNFSHRKEWFASQNMCPHKMLMTLGRGMVGDHGGIPVITCPMHKKSFYLTTGRCDKDEHLQIHLYDVKIENGYVYIRVPEDDSTIPGIR